MELRGSFQCSTIFFSHVWFVCFALCALIMPNKWWTQATTATTTAAALTTTATLCDNINTLQPQHDNDAQANGYYNYKPRHYNILCNTLLQIIHTTNDGGITNRAGIHYRECTALEKGRTIVGSCPSCDRWRWCAHGDWWRKHNSIPSQVSPYNATFNALQTVTPHLDCTARRIKADDKPHITTKITRLRYIGNDRWVFVWTREADTRLMVVGCWGAFGVFKKHCCIQAKWELV